MINEKKSADALLKKGIRLLAEEQGKTFDYEETEKETETLEKKYIDQSGKKPPFLWLLRATYLRGYAAGLERARALFRKWSKNPRMNDSRIGE